MLADFYYKPSQYSTAYPRAEMHERVSSFLAFHRKEEERVKSENEERCKKKCSREIKGLVEMIFAS
jgi:hypothetical protein